MTKKSDEIRVTNIDSKGNIIEDLSKIVIPRERQIRLLNEINRAKFLESQYQLKEEDKE
ncbi:hypothetical protein AB6878_04800 [Carnobacterium maltaromaticum]|uniref:hypothetical protein n=1 Tax=Carnobacterium maltaromaticum TaxID=2751 RepID=UPI0039BEAE0C